MINYTIGLKYPSKNGKKWMTKTIHNNCDGFLEFRTFVTSGQWTIAKRRPTVQNNLDTMFCWLAGEYCHPDTVLDAIFQDLFSKYDNDRERAKKFFKILESPDTTTADFRGLDLI